MSRVQLALNVDDLDASIAFYTKLFQTPPAKIREDYANFAIADPPLKLVLFANSGEPGTLEPHRRRGRDHRRGRSRHRPHPGTRLRPAHPGERVVLLRGAGQDLGQGPRERLGVLHRARRRSGHGMRHRRHVLPDRRLNRPDPLRQQRRRRAIRDEIDTKVRALLDLLQSERCLPARRGKCRDQARRGWFRATLTSPI